MYIYALEELKHLNRKLLLNFQNQNIIKKVFKTNNQPKKQPFKTKLNSVLKQQLLIFKPNLHRLYKNFIN